MGQTGVELNNTCPHNSKPVRNGKVKRQLCKLPCRLVGTKCTAQVSIAGQQVNCLSDTGSQVTTVPLSFFESTLKEQQIRPQNDSLEIEGANGQQVPYFGFVELNVILPKEYLGKEVQVPTLAPDVPDMRENR